jgi:hypothetical protein
MITNKGQRTVQMNFNDIFRKLTSKLDQRHLIGELKNSISILGAS